MWKKTGEHGFYQAGPDFTTKCWMAGQQWQAKFAGQVGAWQALGWVWHAQVQVFGEDFFECAEAGFVVCQCDQVAGMCVQQGQRAGGAWVVAQGQGAADAAQVGPAGQVGGQQLQPAIFKIDFQSQDGPDAGLAAGLDEFDRAGQGVVVGQAQGRHAAGPGRLDQFGRKRQSFQERVGRVSAEMDVHWFDSNSLIGRNRNQSGFCGSGLPGWWG